MSDFVRGAPFLERLSLGRGTPRLDLPYAKGVRSWLAEPGPFFSMLLPCLAGVARPRHGKIWLAGQEPHRSGAVRARIGCLFEDEPRLDLSLTARAYRDRVAALRGEPALDVDWLFGGTWFDRPLNQLGPRERSRLALGLAVSTPRPLLLALHEPLRWLDPGEEAAFLRCLNQLDETMVVLTTHEAQVAARFDQAPLQFGRDPEQVSPQTRTLLLTIERPRDVATLLCNSSVVHGAHFDPRRPRQLRVVGEDDDALDRAVMLAIIEARCDVTEIARSTSLRMRGT